MKQLKVSTTWLKRTRTLSDAEKGRLFTAMLQYAIDGIAPAISGRESLLWDEAEEQIDRQRASYDRQQAPNEARRNEALRGRNGGVTVRNEGVTPTNAHEEKASPQSSPTPLSITPLKEKKKTSPKGESKESSISPALQEALQAFKEMRQTMRKPMTPLAVELLVKRLAKMGDEKMQIAILHQSIENGWTGVWELKGNKHDPKSFNNYHESRDSVVNLDAMAPKEEDF